MRARIWLAGLGVLLSAGCGAEQDRQVAVPEVEPVTVEVAAASSGGACKLLDFAAIAKHTGGRFDVAAASDQGDTHTCVVRAEGATWPELMLTVTDTSIDVPTFNTDLRPDGAVTVSKLGQVAYRRTSAKTAKHGPVAEVGWLATEDRLATLRWTSRPNAARAEADAQATKLIALARTLNTRAM
ncbi:hypothetical protein [Micromonospora sp. DT47]|uniref:hypothetical protein n=1 Tax=Micromonospora sp. DT47 TaxID=3393431 RepID=UPI003CFB5B7D